MKKLLLNKNDFLILGVSLALAILIPLIVYLNKKPTKTLTTEAAFLPAKMTLIPSRKDLEVGETLEILINLSSQDPINTVTANLTYSENLLAIEKIDTSISFATIWFEKNTENPGKINLTASLPTPGFSGEGTLAKLILKTLKGGEAQINFSPTSAVFRNKDSVNILGSSINAAFLIF